ncbi:hypothetical protein U9M48_004681 [Paspalum notatum var. saurae]|uniref:Retrotransposon gag domain-containing protein n=1 Tax=Paspalum notatum var. saurae TaxID=547442 RepID=A0AAQ3PN55_PASNO
MLLDEIGKKFAEQDAKWEKRIAMLEAVRDERVEALEHSAAAFQSWQPQVEQKAATLEAWRVGVDESIVHTDADITDLRLELRKVSKHWERAVLERTVHGPPLLPLPLLVSARAPGGLLHADGPNGHCLPHHHRDLGFESVVMPNPIPVKDRFGKNQHEVLLRQFHNIRQTGSVGDYVHRFTELVDQLAAYETNTDQLHFTTRFIYGLSDEIKAVVMVQRPSDLDTACSLALIQEEAVGHNHRKDFRKFSNSTQVRSSFGPGQLPLTSNSTSNDRLLQDEKRKVDVAKRSSEQDKLSALRAYRRARGLCDRCAEKWSRDHKCSTTIQLQTLQEVFELFQLDSVSDSEQEVASELEEQVFLALSEAAVTGSEPPRTLRLWGQIQSIPILILIDSGSSSTFLSQKIADQLSGVTELALPLSVRVANGGTLHSCAEIKQAQWHIQSCRFQADLRILPLAHYDMILGMDWLEKFSPMKVHWALKWLQIPLDGNLVQPQGLLPAVHQFLVGAVVQVFSIAPASESSAQDLGEATVPAAVQS